MEFIAWQKFVQLIDLLSDILYYLYKQDKKFVGILHQNSSSFKNFIQDIFKTINNPLKNKKTNNIFVLIDIQSHEIIYNNNL